MYQRFIYVYCKYYIILAIIDCKIVFGTPKLVQTVQFLFIKKAAPANSQERIYKSNMVSK